jgi:hypothetical protein
MTKCVPSQWSSLRPCFTEVSPICEGES